MNLRVVGEVVPIVIDVVQWTGSASSFHEDVVRTICCLSASSFHEDVVLL